MSSMFAAFQSTRKKYSRAVTRSFTGLAFLALAACEPIDLSSLGGSNTGQRIDPDSAVPVALLIPRGGNNPGDDLLAKSLENAALLAVSELQGAKIDLRVYSTAGNPQRAALQAQQAVSDGAKIILGPVYAEAANAAAVAVADQNVNVLSFSNNTSIAGGNVFVLGPTFDNTAQRLVSYAASQGRNRIVVVHSNDVAGQSGRNAIQNAASKSGAQIVGAVDYELSQTGVANAVPRVKGAVDANNANAVFMTSTSSGALPLYAGLLPEAGVNPATTKYIGLTRWDIPAQTLSLGGLQGGWFALPDPSRTAAFNSRYQARFGASPHPIGGLAFDGVAAIGALIAQGKKDALTSSALTQANGFEGVSGVFRLRPNGTNQRAIAVATVQNGQAVIVDPAPRSFSGF